MAASRLRAITSDWEAQLLLSATAGAAVIGHVYRVDDPHPNRPDDNHIGRRIDLALKRLSAGWRS